VTLQTLQIAMSVVVVGLTLSLWRTTSLLFTAMDLPPKPRRHALKRTLRTVGAWQVSIAGFLISDSAWINAVSLLLIGSMFFFAPNLMVGGALTPRRGEEPDFKDQSDIERWLNEQ